MEPLHALRYRSRSGLSDYYRRAVSKTSKTFRRRKGEREGETDLDIDDKLARELERQNYLQPIDVSTISLMSVEPVSHHSEVQDTRVEDQESPHEDRELQHRNKRTRHEKVVRQGFSVVPPEFAADVFSVGKILEFEVSDCSNPRNPSPQVESTEANVKFGVIIERRDDSSKCIALSNIVDQDSADYFQELEALPPPLALVYDAQAPVPPYTGKHAFQPLRAEKSSSNSVTQMPLIGILDYGRTFDIAHDKPVRTVAQIMGLELSLLQSDWKRTFCDEPLGHSKAVNYSLPFPSDAIPQHTDSQTGKLRDSSTKESTDLPPPPGYNVAGNDIVSLMTRVMDLFVQSREEQRERDAEEKRMKEEERRRVEQGGPFPSSSKSVETASNPSADRAAEKLKKLEDLLQAQMQAKIDKEAKRQKEAEEAKKAAEEEKRRSEEDRLLQIHELIIASRDEQIAREEALEARRAAEKAEAESKALEAHRDAERAEVESDKAAMEAIRRQLNVLQAAVDDLRLNIHSRDEQPFREEVVEDIGAAAKEDADFAIKEAAEKEKRAKVLPLTTEKAREEALSVSSGKVKEAESSSQMRQGEPKSESPSVRRSITSPLDFPDSPPSRDPKHHDKTVLFSCEENFQRLLRAGEPSRVKQFMQDHPEVLDEEKFAWVQELLDFGCSSDEVVDLLISRAQDSPWIYFEQREILDARPRIDWHIRSCPHTKLVEDDLDDSPLPTDTENLSRTSSLTSSSGYSGVKNKVEGLCGLGGISPSTRNLFQWTGRASFDFDKQEASISYNTHNDRRLQILQNLQQVIHNLCCAASLLQDSRLCCDSFTLLVLPEGSQVEMVRIPFSYLVSMYSITSEMIDSFESPNPPKVLNLLTDLDEPLFRMLEALRQTPERTEDSKKIEDIELCSLIIQLLSVGFLSYMQAHMTPLEPFFLDRDIRKVLLFGAREPGGDPGIIAEPITLTCMNDMLRGEVLVFRPMGVQAPESRLHLSGTPEDILDTWGPGCFLTVPGKEDTEELLGIRIKGGTIMASKEDPTICHWFPTTFLQLSDHPFKKSGRVTVGAPPGSLTVIRTSCHKNEEDFFDQYESILDQLGTYAGHWEVVQHQFTFQFSVPYVALQYGRTLGKVPTRTIKEEQLSKEKLDIGFLESFWGLQISICTGVARRVRMREVIADMLPNYVARGLETPDPWFEAEKDEIVGAFRDEENTINLRDWLRKTKKEHRDFLLGAARGIVDLLKSTGIDSEDCLAIACIMPEETRCLRIKCEHESYWAKMLADSETCATFAYFTRKCLETDTIECSGPSASWPSTSILSTAVSLHQKSDHAKLVSSQLVLQNGEKYFIGKHRFRLQVTVEQRPADHTRLLLSESKLRSVPNDVWRRFVPREAKRRLRERQGRTSTAKPVLVLVDEPSVRTSYSRSPQHLSPSPQPPAGDSNSLQSASGTIAGPSS
ncbi:hypothetical protein IWZ01DRAFT_493227 [Phyllosticta capitalensis]